MRLEQAEARKIAHSHFGHLGTILFEYTVIDRRFDAVIFAPELVRTNGEVRILEFKSGRSDFQRDRKWPKYLPFCNLFAFVAPPGAIAPHELPEGVGLFIAADGKLRQAKRWLSRPMEPAAREAVYSRLVLRSLEHYRRNLYAADLERPHPWPVDSLVDTANNSDGRASLAGLVRARELPERLVIERCGGVDIAGALKRHTGRVPAFDPARGAVTQ